MQDERSYLAGKEEVRAFPAEGALSFYTVDGNSGGRWERCNGGEKIASSVFSVLPTLTLIHVEKDNPH